MIGGGSGKRKKESFVQWNFACNLHISLTNDLTSRQIWQLQVAVAAGIPYPPPHTLPTLFPCSKKELQPIQRLQLQLLLQFMHSSGSSTTDDDVHDNNDDDDEATASALVYLVYLVSFICRMHFAVVLIVECASVLFLSRKQHGAHHHYAAQIINKMYISFFSRIEALYQFCSGFKRFRRRNVYTKNIY